MVANRRQERVLWLRDYLTELVVFAIYSVQGRWLLILEWRAGDRREGKSLAQVIPWLSPWQCLRR
jgi:hypothetical protein